MCYAPPMTNRKDQQPTAADLFNGLVILLIVVMGIVGICLSWEGWGDLLMLLAGLAAIGLAIMFVRCCLGLLRALRGE